MEQQLIYSQNKLRVWFNLELVEIYLEFEFQKEVPKEVPVSPKRSFQRQISAPSSPEKLSDGERSTSESSNPGDEVDGR